MIKQGDIVCSVHDDPNEASVHRIYKVEKVADNTTGPRILIVTARGNKLTYAYSDNVFRPATEIEIKRWKEFPKVGD